MSQSEVARLRERIAAEYEASKRAIEGVAAGVAQHKVIRARLDRMHTLTGELAQHIGQQAAMHVFAETLEGCELPSPPQHTP